MLGRGRFAKVVASGDDDKVALKIIDIDDQKQPHNWKVEIAALERLQTAANVIHMIHWSANLASMEPQVNIEMPRYSLTLEHVIYHYAKANYPPGSGWRNVMSVQRISSIVGGIAKGLDSVHSQGIIHRDIKPENIMFSSPEGEPVLLDFGISWVPGLSEHSEPFGNRITDVSSAEYKAPELLFGIRHYTEKIDLWALGCILGRLLGSDCTPLFTPYTSDMALIAAQVRGIAPPKAMECPSLAGSVAEYIPNFDGHTSVSASTSATDKAANTNSTLMPVAKSFRKLEGSDLLGGIATKLLSYEWTMRPTAREVFHQIQEFQGKISL